MLLFFSDWTDPRTLSMLHDGGIQAERLIKVFASEENPSSKLRRDIAVIESNDAQFTERYQYPGRGYWLGEEMEEFLYYLHMPDEEVAKARALFRFSNRPDLEIAQLAMRFFDSETGKPRYGHPLDIIDGLTEARERKRYGNLHLDIFTPPSLERLGKLVDVNDTEKLVTIRESVMIARQTPEGQNPNPERLV